MEICPTVRNFFARQTRFFAGILGGFQEKSGQYGEKKTTGLGVLTFFKQALTSTVNIGMNQPQALFLPAADSHAHARTIGAMDSLTRFVISCYGY